MMVVYTQEDCEKESAAETPTGTLSVSKYSPSMKTNTIGTITALSHRHGHY